MSLRTVLYQSVFKAPFVPPNPPSVFWFDDRGSVSSSKVLKAALIASMQFSAWTGFNGTYVPPAQTPNRIPWNTPFDAPEAPQFKATEQQFTVWHSPFFGTKTPITPEWTAFDQPRAPRYPAAEQQFSAFNGNISTVAPTPAYLSPNTPFDQLPAPQYKASEQQFTSWHSPFFGTQTPITPDWTPFDTPKAPQYSAAQQQFSTFNFVPATPAQTPAYATFFTPFDEPQTPKYSAAQQEFTATGEEIFVQPYVFWGESNQYKIVGEFTSQQQFATAAEFVPAPIVTLIGPFTSTPFDEPRAPQFAASKQQFTAWYSPAVQNPTLITAFDWTPFDEPRAPQYAAAQQQFSAFHTPFPVAQTPAYLSTFVPFDEPRALQYNSAQQQYSAYSGSIVQFTQTPNYLAQFYVDTTVPHRPLSPALVQFNDLPMGPEQTTAAEQPIGRWGPDETDYERKRREKAQREEDQFKLQWDLDLFQDVRRAAGYPEPIIPIGEIEPVEKIEPQTLSLERDPPGPGLFKVDQVKHEDDIFDDPEIQRLVEKLIATGWRK